VQHQAVSRARRLHPESTGDWDLVAGLTESALARGSSAAQQRAAAARGGLQEVVDTLLAETHASTDSCQARDRPRDNQCAVAGIDNLCGRHRYHHEADRRMGMIFNNRQRS
jgi:hypothetical protein